VHFSATEDLKGTKSQQTPSDLIPSTHSFSLSSPFPPSPSFILILPFPLSSPISSWKSQKRHKKESFGYLGGRDDLSSRVRSLLFSTFVYFCCSEVLWEWLVLDVDVDVDVDVDADVEGGK